MAQDLERRFASVLDLGVPALALDDERLELRDEEVVVLWWRGGGV
jgi:hypothetical protein